MRGILRSNFERENRMVEQFGTRYCDVVREIEANSE
jgi:hypothetical protein